MKVLLFEHTTTRKWNGGLNVKNDYDSWQGEYEKPYIVKEYKT